MDIKEDTTQLEKIKIISTHFDRNIWIAIQGQSVGNIEDFIEISKTFDLDDAKNLPNRNFNPTQQQPRYQGYQKARKLARAATPAEKISK